MKSEYELLKEIRKDDGTIKAELIPDDLKKEILEIEMDRTKELIPVINEGINEAFKEKEIMIIIKHQINDKIKEDITPMPSLTLLTETGRIVGEEIYDQERINELKKDENAYFVSSNFVTYNLNEFKDEKQFFKVSKGDNELFTDKNLKEYSDSITVAIPSIHSDRYIKQYYGYSPDEKIGSIIVGFTPTQENN